jgi:endo-alpha-N-acetylgalactosaminidase
VITGYRVYASTDGQEWTRIASGAWPADASMKTVPLGAGDVRYLRLEAVSGSNRLAQVSELEVLGTSVGG